MHKTYGSKKEGSSQDSKEVDKEGCKAQDSKEDYEEGNEAITSLVRSQIVLCPTFKKALSGAFLILERHESFSGWFDHRSVAARFVVAP